MAYYHVKQERSNRPQLPAVGRGGAPVNAVDRLGATLRWLDPAGHGYKVLKRTRTRTDDVSTEMAAYAKEFVLDR